MKKLFKTLSAVVLVITMMLPNFVVFAATSVPYQKTGIVYTVSGQRYYQAQTTNEYNGVSKGTEFWLDASSNVVTKEDTLRKLSQISLFNVAGLDDLILSGAESAVRATKNYYGAFEAIAVEKELGTIVGKVTGTAISLCAGSPLNFSDVLIDVAGEVLSVEKVKTTALIGMLKIYANNADANLKKLDKLINQTIIDYGTLVAAYTAYSECYACLEAIEFLAGDEIAEYRNDTSWNRVGKYMLNVLEGMLDSIIPDLEAVEIFKDLKTGVLAGISLIQLTLSTKADSVYASKKAEIYNSFMEKSVNTVKTAEKLAATISVPVTNVRLNKTSLSLEVGDTKTLTATISPSNATNKNVTWTSSNHAVAKVTNGVVTAVGVGSATITATTVDGSKTVTCAVKVELKKHYIEGTNLYWTLNDAGVLTVAGKGSMPNWNSSSQAPWSRLNVKAAIIEDGVTCIGNYAFYCCTSLASVTIPESVTSIGDDAFYDCSALKEVYISSIESWFKINFNGYHANPLFCADNGLYIDGNPITELTIPNSVTTIPYSAFYNCGSLTSITIPDSVTSIGDYAFSKCTSLTSVTIPDSVTSIGDLAFWVCTSLTSLTIPDSVTSIGERAFYYCTSLTSVTIGDSVISIGASAFEDCTSLTSITIPDSVTSIDEGAFRGCTSLTSITIPDGVTSIGDDAFSDCESLTSITIPDGVTSIGWYAFSDCESLTSITIPDGVTSIGDDAFQNCKSLTSITIPDSVTSIGWYAFHNCTSLTSITIPDSVTSIDSYALGYYYNSGYKLIDDFTIYGYTGSEAETYANNNGINFVALALEETEAEKNYIEGTEVWWTLENGVLTVGGEGEIPDFVRSNTATPWISSAKQITSIVVEDGITGVGNYAFYNLSKATSITVAESVKFVGIQFIRGTAITEIELPGVEVIAGNAFGAADSLAKITLSENVYDIYGNMFYANTVTVVAPEGSYVDYYLRMYTEVFGTKANPTFEANGTAQRLILDFAKVGQTAFYTLYEDSTDNWTLVYSGSDKMTNFAYYSQKNIDRGLAFSPARNLFEDGNKCVYIKNVILGDGLNNLGNYALEMCTKVKTVELGDKMTRIGRDAFRSVAIKSLVIPEGVVLIDNQAFANCNALASLTIPSTITADDPNAMSYDKMGLGFDLFLKCKPATQENYETKLVITTENRVVIDYLIENYPIVARNSGFID